MTLPDRTALDLVIAAIAPIVGGAMDTSVRSRFAASGWGNVTRAAQDARLDAIFARAGLDQGLFAGLPRLTGPDGSATPPLWAETCWSSHVARRGVLREKLLEIVGRFNAAGLTPILLKGARSLWTGVPGWRMMGDLDILVPGGAAAEAQAILIAAGFATRPEAAYDADFHHEDNLYRADLPGWVEIHRAGASWRAEALLGTAEIDTCSTIVQVEGASARILPAPLDLIHNLAHHHFGHWEAYNGRLAPKAMFEFAGAFSALTGDERNALAHRAARSPLLLSTIELWLAAAQDTFGIAVPAPFIIADDATQRWQTLAPPPNTLSRIGGILAEITPAIRPARLRRTTGGNTALGRARLRLAVLGWAAGAWGYYYLRERWH